MLANIFFFVLVAGAFSQESSHEIYSDFDFLQNLTQDGLKKVLQTLTNVNNAANEYDDFAEERFDSLMWECTVQQQNLNKSVMEAVFKGMNKNKQFPDFQCISNNADVTLNKFDQMRTQIPLNSQKIKEKRLAEVMPFKFTLSAFSSYIQDLYKKKYEEMKETDKEVSRKKILEEVAQKMKLICTIMEKVNELIKTNKFKFIEEYINFAFATENALKNIQKEGAKSIMKCVA